MAERSLLDHRDTEAEMAVLGSMLLLPRVVPDVLAMLSADDFYDVKHQLIYRAIAQVDAKGQEPDPILVSDALKSSGHLDNVGYEYVHALCSTVAAASRAVHYATIVKRHSMDRKLTRVMHSFAEGQQGSPEETLAAIQDALLALEEDSTDDAIPLSDLLSEHFAHLEAIAKTDRKLAGMASRFVDLDKLLSGFEPSQLTIIAGRPSMGKTAFALNLMVGFAEEQPKLASLFFSLEMAKMELVTRLIAHHTRINGHKLKTSDLTDVEWKEVLAAHQHLANYNMYVDDKADLSVADIRARARRLHRKKGLSAVFVDYIQLVKPQKSYDMRDREVAEVSKGLKNLAKELQIPVIALAQLNRNVESRQDKRPGLADLRESGSIEQDADICLFLYRDEYYNANSPDIGIVELLTRKNRNGPTGDCRLAFAAEYGRFSNLPKGRFSGSSQLQPYTPHPCESKDRTEGERETDSERQLSLD
jgi:replicative DNA helicase